jgi:hypothetical protein
MRLYHKDGVHLNLSGSYKLAENIGITCKTKTLSQSNTQQKRHHTNINNSSILPLRDAQNIEQIRDLPLGKTVDNITNKTIQTIWNIIILETRIWVGMMYGI